VRIEVTESTPRTTGTVPAGRPVATSDPAAAADPEAAVAAAEPAVAAADPQAAVAAADPVVAARPRGFVGGLRPDLGRLRPDLGRLRNDLDRLRNDLDRLGAVLADRFRLPASHDPAPQPARMLGVCAWATALGVVGVGVALRALVALLAGQTPGWFEPTITIAGLLGIGLTAAAFAAVHRRRLPWALLGAATLMLGVTLVANLAAL
jgi:hypothetical protein